MFSCFVHLFDYSELPLWIIHALKKYALFSSCWFVHTQWYIYFGHKKKKINTGSEQLCVLQERATKEILLLDLYLPTAIFVKFDQLSAGHLHEKRKQNSAHKHGDFYVLFVKIYCSYYYPFCVIFNYLLPCSHGKL